MSVSSNSQTEKVRASTKVYDSVVSGRTGQIHFELIGIRNSCCKSISKASREDLVARPWRTSSCALVIGGCVTKFSQGRAKDGMMAKVEGFCSRVWDVDWKSIFSPKMQDYTGVQ